MGTMEAGKTAPSRRHRTSNETLIVIALLGVALVWRVVYFLEMGASPYGGSLTLDSEVYHEVAREVANGRWSDGTTFFQPPLYPWLLGMVYAVFGPIQTVAKLLQVLLSVVSCWLVYRIAERVFDRTVAWVALGASAVYGMNLYFANELLAVTLIVFLDLLGLDLLLRASDDGGLYWWGAAGVVFGMSTIARPTILPVIAGLCIWIAIDGWRAGRLRVALLEIVVFVAAVALPVAPVTLHNYLADGDPVLVSANGGVNFFIGNNPQSDGITAALPGARPDRRAAQIDQIRIARDALGDPNASPAEVSDFWYDRAWQYIRSEPGRAIRHTAYKAFILFNAHEISNNRVIEFVTRHSRLFTWATLRYWLILPLAVAGVIVARGRPREKAVLLVFAAVYSATLVPFFINARFRMPVVAVLIVFAASAVVAWSRLVRERVYGWRVALSVVAALLMSVAARPLPALRVPDAQACFNEAEAYRAREDYASATVWYRAALDAHPGYCDAAFNLARIYAEISPDPYRVIEILQPVVTPCAEDLGIRRMLGQALCAVGRCEEGGEHLRVVEDRSTVAGVD